LELLNINKIIEQKVELSQLKFSCNPNDIHKFLTSFHYLGNTNRVIYSYSMQLHGEDIIIGVFGQPVRQEIEKGKVLELVRLCRHPHFFNKNMVSYFLSKCVKELYKYKYNCIVSYADLRYHNGSIYKASNWIDKGLTAPDYEYMSITNIPMHKKTLYNRAIKEGLKENEYVEKYEFKKISIGQKKKFVYYF
jgi:5'(3')-deoxyribonucleotidase